MGMYNEVFDTCPRCNRRSGYVQIYQIVLGFGEFDLSDLAYLKQRYDRGELSAKDLHDLADALEDEVFYCKNRHGEDHDCCHSWRLDPAKLEAIRMLPTVNVGDTKARALELLREAGILED